MIVLKEHSLTMKDVIRPNGMKLELTERASTANPDFNTGNPPDFGDWIKTTEWPAEGIVWRIRDMDDQTAGDNRWSMKLEHIINILKDTTLRGEVKPADITGNKKDGNCTAKQAVQFILKKQNDWVLGDFAFSKSAPYSFNGDDLFSAIETVTGSLDGAYWEYDLTKYPFKLHIRKKDDTLGGEMRLSRNIIGPIRITTSRSGMYTRIIPTGKNNLKLPEGSLTKNVSLYGDVHHQETDQSLDTVQKLRDWAQERLDNHCEPPVSIQVPGVNLSRATKEDLDDIKLNRYCRIPLPKWGNTIKEYVTKLSWPDCIKDPEGMNVTLANNQNDVTSIIANISKSGHSGRGGRVDAVNAEEDHAWFEDTTDHVSMVAMAIIGKDPDGVDWKRVADITVDGEGIHQTVTAMKGDIKKYGTKLEQDEKKIGLVVGTYDSGGNYIKAGEICMAINESGQSEATIEASKIHLLGQTIAQQISAEYISAKMAAIPTLNVNNVIAKSVKIPVGSSGVPSNVATETYVSGCPYDLRITQSGDTYKLQWKRLGGSASWSDVGSFSRATSLGGVWSSGVLTVTATPQGNTLTAGLFDLTNSDVSWNGTTGTVKVNANLNGGETKYDTGKRLTVHAPFSQVQLAKAYDRYDNVYYGRLYDANGNALTSNSYYWYGASYNYDGGSANATFYRHT